MCLSVRPSVCAKVLIKHWCNLEGICFTVTPVSDCAGILVTFNVDIWPRDVKSTVARRSMFPSDGDGLLLILLRASSAVCTIIALFRGDLLTVIGRIILYERVDFLTDVIWRFYNYYFRRYLWASRSICVRALFWHTIGQRRTQNFWSEGLRPVKSDRFETPSPLSTPWLFGF